MWTLCAAAVPQEEPQQKRDSVTPHPPGKTSLVLVGGSRGPGILETATTARSSLKRVSVFFMFHKVQGHRTTELIFLEHETR